MVLPGRRTKTLLPQTICKIQVLARRGWSIRRIAAEVDLSYSLTRRLMRQGVEPLRLKTVTPCPACHTPGDVAPCPRCGCLSYQPHQLACHQANEPATREHAEQLAELRAEKARKGYTQRQLEEKYHEIRRARFGTP